MFLIHSFVWGWPIKYAAHQSKIAVETKCNSIKLAFLNIRSLKNKSFLINDLITTNNLDCVFLNETWQKTAAVQVLNETPLLTLTVHVFAGLLGEV